MRRGYTRWIKLVLALCMLGSASAWLVVNEGHLEDARATLDVTSGQLRLTELRLFLAGRAQGTASAQLAQHQAALQQTNTQLYLDGLNLQNTSSWVALEGMDLSTLRTCLNGVAGAYGQLAAQSLKGAVAALGGASAACLETEAAGASGLVYPYDFPDPDVVLVGGTYYAYATNSASGKIQVASSTDLAHWTPAGDALGGEPPWAGPGGVWAPSVVDINGTFVMYYSTVVANTGVQCISVATSASPTGPFVDASTAPLMCQLDLGGSIDPSVFLDPVSGLYLYWKSEGNAGHAPIIWGQQLDATGTHPTGIGPIPLFAPSQGWEHGIVEAPDMISLAGQRYLFYSGSDWQGASYAVGVTACAGPLGPCVKPLPGPILSSQTHIAGPGGESVFTDAVGHPFVAFAAWLPGQLGYPNSRVLFVRPLQVVNGVPTVCPATSCG